MKVDPQVTGLAKQIFALMDSHRSGRLDRDELIASLQDKIGEVERLQGLSRTDSEYISGVRALLRRTLASPGTDENDGQYALGTPRQEPSRLLLAGSGDFLPFSL